MENVSNFLVQFHVNQGGVENCVSLRKVYPGNGARSHGMNDEICSLKFATLCEE